MVTRLQSHHGNNDVQFETEYCFFRIVIHLTESLKYKRDTGNECIRRDRKRNHESGALKVGRDAYPHTEKPLKWETAITTWALQRNAITMRALHREMALQRMLL